MFVNDAITIWLVLLSKRYKSPQFHCLHYHLSATIAGRKICFQGCKFSCTERVPRARGCRPPRRAAAAWEGTRPNGFHLAAMLGEAETAAFKFSTRNLSESSPYPPPPIPLGPFCGCLMHLATLNRYLPRGQGRPPARRGEGRMGPAPGRLRFALTQREPPSLRHKYIFHTCE